MEGVPEWGEEELGTYIKRNFTRQSPSSSAKALEMETCRPTLEMGVIREYGKWKSRRRSLKRHE